MITSAKEYLANLQRIRNQDIHKEILQIPSDELIYNIDLNARTVDAPVYLSRETDHIAETIFFSVDRYYETHDLANSVCIIQYINDLLLFSLPLLIVPSVCMPQAAPDRPQRSIGFL